MSEPKAITFERDGRKGYLVSNILLEHDEDSAYLRPATSADVAAALQQNPDLLAEVLAAALKPKVEEIGRKFRESIDSEETAPNPFDPNDYGTGLGDMAMGYEILKSLGVKA